MKVQKILCATDLSRNSTDGVHYSIAVAKSNRAELIVFHATRFPFPAACPCEANLFWQLKLADKYRVEPVLKDAQLRLKSFLYHYCREEIDEVCWNSKIAIGKVAEEIVTAACQEEIDLIVMAKTKRRVPFRLSRSVSTAVRRKAPCPVVSGDPSRMRISLPSQDRKIRFIRAMLGYGL